MRVNRIRHRHAMSAAVLGAAIVLVGGLTGPTYGVAASSVGATCKKAGLTAKAANGSSLTCVKKGSKLVYAKLVPAASPATTAVAPKTTGAPVSSAAPTTPASPATTAVPTGPATGTPVKVGLLIGATVRPQSESGMKGAIAAVNAAGGVKGHPVELVVCSDNNDANLSAKCARDLTDDKSIIALVGSGSTSAANADPILEAAKIASVGGELSQTPDFSSPVVFPVHIGGQQVAGAAAILTDVLNKKNISIAYIDAPAGAVLPPLIETGVLKPRGLKWNAQVPVAVGIGDVTPQAAALFGSDGIVIAHTQDISARLIKAVRQQYGTQLPIATSGAVFDPASLTDLVGGDMKNVYISSPFNLESKGFQRFLAEMKQYNPTGVTSSRAAAAWLSIKLFTDTANSIPGDVTRASVLAAMEKVSGYDTGGMTRPLDYTVKATAMSGTQPRMFPSVAVVYGYRFGDTIFYPLNDGKPIEALK